ncbi:acyl-CoA N-acyltransferase [Nitzschia inconspicua]|uniref:Acyl-CoA N-acyltransferase n=1 Tax=Nitzschia inconspicua TaxID=303405 RepID=A0A9K3PLX6_9STRA|nr:acyl-CoA N-acyltransferase [Nitzschia inconspicua]KAG7352153.1 acyl-CoA N-acyltransferase [Nitzschia inconspicua]
MGGIFQFIVAIFLSTDSLDDDILFRLLHYQQSSHTVEAFTTAPATVSRFRLGRNSLVNEPPISSLPYAFSALQVSFFSEQTSTDSAKEEDEDVPPAFVIERISNMPINDKLFERISNMCIDVFFKEQLTDAQFLEGTNGDDQQQSLKPGKLYPWKDWQIGYLKNLQASDLRRRRSRFGATNEMFLAYEVLTAAPSVARSRPLILDTGTIYNLSSLTSEKGEEDTCYVRGKLLGFVEITQRPYGIGSPTANDDSTQEIFVNSDGTTDGDTAADPRPLRPVLTNLAVTKEARKYGIGSKLLDECEQHVRKRWKLHEIILEVEDYNTEALKFYLKRGYHVLFSDPASRRYDVRGLWLRKVRCRREVLRKVFHRMDTAGLMESGAMDFFRKVRKGWR